MILYHAYHAGTLNLALIHRMTINKDKEAVLLVGNEQLMGPIYKKLAKLIQLDIFQEVLYCSECFGLREKTVNGCEKAIQQHFDKVFAQSETNITDFEEIYTGVDTLHSFAIYLSLKKKKYYFFEAYKNFFQEAIKRLNNSKNEIPIYVETMLKHGAADGSSPYATRIMRSTSVPIEGAQVFDFETAVYDIEEEYKRKLFAFFDTQPVYSGNTPADVLVTCSQWVLRNFPDVKQRALTIYQYIADYFACSSRNLIIKPHPLSRCSTAEFKENFNGIYVFEKEFPSNFMPIMQNLSIRDAYTICSTGALTFSKQQGNSYLVGYSFYRMYPLIHKVHYLIALYDNFRNYIFSSYGISNEFVENVKNIIFKMYDVPMKWTNVDNIANYFSILDDINWNPGNYGERLLSSIRTCNQDFIIAFLNSKKDDFCTTLFLEDAKQYICIIELKKIKIKEVTVAPTNSEYIVIFAKNSEVREKIESFLYKKELYYTGYIIEAKPLKGTEKEIFILSQMNQRLYLKQEECWQGIIRLEQKLENLLNKE